MEEIIRKASEFALKVHKHHKYGDFSYIKHLIDVYSTLCYFSVKDQNILVAAWLHDVLEMTEITYSSIKNGFNVSVAELVFCVTDELGRNRQERHEKTYPKLQGNPDAIILKQADRLSNVRFSLINKSHHLLMYKKEYPEFKKALKPYGGIVKMWDMLDLLLIGKKWDEDNMGV